MRASAKAAVGWKSLRPGSWLWISALVVFASLTLVRGAQTDEVIPPKPTRYFTDLANVVPESRGHALNEKLAEFERATSSQLLVAIFPKMQSASSIEDYANRVFKSWGVGQKDKNNGAVLFVFSQDRRMRIEVGYGLEGVMPDAVCKRIIEDEIVPRFRAGDFAGGMEAGVNAMLSAAKGEYKGTGRTAAEARNRLPGAWPAMVLVIFFVGIIVAFIVVSSLLQRVKRGTLYTGRGWRRHSPQQSTWNWWVDGSGGGGGGGGSWSGFSGGGGSSGGGGASGSW